MIRVLVYFLVLLALAYGGMLLVENPGHIRIVWYGYDVNAPAALLLAIVAVAAIVVWALLRFVLGLPSAVGMFARQRRREKGYAALSRGLIAVNSGDGRTAERAAVQAARHLKGDPLALMLRAQSAGLNGDERGAHAAFEELSQRPETRLLGLRGLHAEAVRRGDDEAARHFATIAYRTAALPWSAEAVLAQRAADGDWEKALSTVEAGLTARLIDRETGERQRAVLETAIALQKEATSPDQALTLARSAMKRAPDLAPAVALATRLLARRGDIRRATRLVEKAWPRCQHPDVARAYLDVRPGDSTTDRLARAKTLMGIAAFDPVSRLTVAGAALASKDFGTARAAMAPLIAEGQRPTVRACLLMAEIEEAEYGDIGQWREWVARAARAPLDPAWVADGIVYERWEPTSPTTGKLDAFRWQVPAERLGPAMEALPARAAPPQDGVLSARVDGALPAPSATATPAEASADGPPLFHRPEVEPEAPIHDDIEHAEPGNALFHRQVSEEMAALRAAPLSETSTAAEAATAELDVAKTQPTAPTREPPQT